MQSKEAGGNKLPASLISPVTISIFSERPFSSTLRMAISALSGWISSPVRRLQPYFASMSKGMIPVPVPKSNSTSVAFAWANPVRSTASIPKQNFFGF